MKWRGRRRSSNIEDRRGGSYLPRGRGRKLGTGSLILLILASLFFGEDVSKVLGLLLEQQTNTARPTQKQSRTVPNSRDDDAKAFVAVILAETEDTWQQEFANMGRQYRAPKLVLYNDRVESACGLGSAASGPFYCPGDEKIYIDLSFLSELKQMGAPGDFAFAYVIAHEVGHHVQNLVGIANQVHQQRVRVSKAKGNALSVKMELQADCLAGVWINHTEARNAILESGDIEEGMNAASAVGDDRIFKRAGQTPRREAFTHGSSAERVRWFRQGVHTGKLESCNTFA